jgi:ABC-type branched-subunit amino acid transport system substrate-binding protein
MRRILGLAILLVSSGWAGAAGAQDAYVIGATGAMTGPAAANFAPVVEAMKAYLDDLNARGGVNGKPVKVIVQDDSGEPSKAAANAKKLLSQDRVLVLVSSSPSSTYAPLVVETKRAGVPLYYAGAVCPKETYPPADALQFCSTAYGATLDSQAALAFVKAQAKEPVRIGFATMAIPVARAEIEYAEQLAKTLGMTTVETQITPPPAPDYTPFATRLKDANPNWVYSWSPWVSQVRTFEALRRLGWDGRYITWAHLNAEEELARLKDGNLYVFGTNALFQDNLPIHGEIRATTQRANLKYPSTYLAEGFIAGLVVESVLKNTPWPPTPATVVAAMNTLKVDLKGLRGGPLEWTPENHFRTTQHYRVWRWDPAKQAIVQVQDWQAIPVKR